MFLNQFVRNAGAERLVGRAMSLHPGKPENWYWEKVIWDLERDRQ